MNQKLIGSILIILGLISLTVAILIQFDVIKINESYNDSSGANNREWKPLGKTAWFPVFGNTFVYNNKLEYKKEGNHYRYRVISYNRRNGDEAMASSPSDVSEQSPETIYDIVQIQPLYNGSVIQVANPTNPMSVEMAVQINDGKDWTSN